MASGLYAGQGTTLYLASSNPQEPVWLSGREADPVIPTGEVSIGFPVNAGIKTVINVLFNAVPTTATSIEYDVNPDFGDAIIIDTLTAVALQAIAVWTTAEYLTGFIRVSNTSDAQINLVTAQSLATTAV